MYLKPQGEGAKKERGQTYAKGISLVSTPFARLASLVQQK
jgi:hypothetical protein